MVMRTIQPFHRIHATQTRPLLAVIQDPYSPGGKSRNHGIPGWLIPLVTLWWLTQPLQADVFEDFQYTDNGTGITIDYYMGTGDEFGAVVIPESIIGKPVTHIGDYSFRGRNEVTSVLIPDSVTSIGDFAFAECDNLTGMTIPQSVTSLGEGSFSGCDGLTSVTIPGSVIQIAQWTFSDCTHLMSVTISSGVTGIREGAFTYCTGLTSVMIPDSVTSIDVGAFMRCTGLTSISVDEANPNFSSAGGVLFNKAQTRVILCPEGMSAAYTIPDGVTDIGASAFSHCAGLTGVTIPGSVVTIGGGAFSQCGGLTSVSIPAGVTSIGTWAFANCGGLISIVVDAANQNFTSTDGVLFNLSKSLLIQCPAGISGDYVIPTGVTHIGDGAFSGCGRPWGSELPVGLTSITIPNTVTSIGSRAFADCNTLTSITIPAGVTRIEDWTFSECSGLTSVTIPAGVTSIGSGAFSGCGQTWDPSLPGGLESITIPDSVTSIGDWAFSRCNRLTSITIPAGVTRIGDYTFSYCTALQNVIIPHGVTSIGEGAFSCGDYGWGDETPVGLVSVTIPDTVTSIGNQAFSACNRLVSVAIPDSVISIGNSAFHGCRSLTSVEVPDSVTSIGYYAFARCTGMTSVTISAGITSITVGLFSNCTALESVIIPHGVTSIGDEAFSCGESWEEGGPPAGLAAISIPDSVTRIGNSAFRGCNRLASLSISERVISIGQTAFLNCSSLTSINIPASVTSIGVFAFSGCSSLASISVATSNPSYCSSDGALYDKPQTLLIQCPAGMRGAYVIPEGVTSIGDQAFSHCSGLNAVTIPDSVTQIGYWAFWGCSGLATMEIAAGVTSIGESAFHACSGLTSISVDPANPNFMSINGVVFNRDRTSLIQFPLGRIGAYAVPVGVTGIGYEAFAGCSGLTQVTIPASVTGIGSSAFWACSTLNSAVFAGNAPSMGWDVFGGTSADFTVYFFHGRTGFTTPTWLGYPAVAMDPAPAAVTGAASGITAEIAVLQGTVNPNGATTITQFEYGTTSAYGQVATATLWPNNGTSAVTVSAGVSGLRPGQIYHYRLTATNPSGTGLGEDMTFATNTVLTVVASHGVVLPSSGQYTPGTKVELTATPSPGYIFGGWTGDATGSVNPLAVLMETNKTVTVNFLPDTTDNDGDGLSNHDEIVSYGTNPGLADTDGDDLNDASEVGLGHFWIIAGTFTWAQARADAHARGGELACFPTAVRWDRAMASLGANAFDNFTGLWIGASDATEEGNWAWVNGEAFTFSQWATSRPSTTSGNTLDFAEISGGGGAELGKWYDRTATLHRDGYILETGYLTSPTTADTDGDGFDDGFETNAGFNPTLSTSTPEGMASLHILPGSIPPAVEFRFNAARGASYRIEASSDLTNWSAVETAIAGQGTTMIRSYSTEDLPRRFFRAGRN